MKIISGKYKGRIIKGYDIDGTRPTQDRIKESLFAMIQDDIRNSICLDLFAGSGSLGIEALSNGASRCYFVDVNPKCIDILKQNLRDINIENYNILCDDYNNVLNSFSGLKFDIIFLDPPYSLNCLDDILNKITNNNLLNDEGIVVCEYENSNFKDDYSNLDLIKERKYGYKNIRIYRYISNGS